MTDRLGASIRIRVQDDRRALPKAAAEMEPAEALLKAMKPDEALAPEQRALKMLQDAEQQYEMQVAQQQGGGGGGGGQSQMAEDLADLFELELDKLANQYEMQQRAEQQASDQQIDELAEKLKELARRQQQEAERQRAAGAAGLQQQQRAAAAAAASGNSRRKWRKRRAGSSSCRASSSGRTSPTRRSSCRMRPTRCGRRRPTARRTAARWRRPRSTSCGEAQQKLDAGQNGRAQRDIQNALRKAQELADEQKEVASEVGSWISRRAPIAA